MSKTTKRFLALFLALLMFSGNAMGVLAEVVPEMAAPASEAGENAERTAGGAPDTYELDPSALHVSRLGEIEEETEEPETPDLQYGPNDLVRVSIVLDQPSTLEQGYATVTALGFDCAISLDGREEEEITESLKGILP